MTLGMAWLRTVGDVRELVIASDSRLSGGQYWDANPKIMLLPRSDAVLSFAGSTSDAYSCARLAETREQHEIRISRMQRMETSG